MRTTNAERRIAYFSMEIALEPQIPTYAGGLGVLAGDILRSAADLEVPIVGVTLLHRNGYFLQRLDESGRQSEGPDSWSPEQTIEALPALASLQIGPYQVKVRPWLYRMSGITGFTVPVILLDTALPDNQAEDRALTDQLYGGDHPHRLRQEALLGLGGVAVLRELGYAGDLVYHMNEGHSSLLALALLEERLAQRGCPEPSEADVEAIRQRCVFTTHTPVPAGHDKFPHELVGEVLGPTRVGLLEASRCLLDGVLNLTYLGLRFSSYINGVSMRHGEVSLGMFPDYPVQAITNGVHAVTWTSDSFAALFDRYIPGWRHDNRYLRYAVKIPLTEIRGAHEHAKQELCEAVGGLTGVQLDPGALTLGFARRATPYKRADLLLRQPARLRQIARAVGPLQIIYAGKAHPRDEQGKELIQRIFAAGRDLKDAVRLVYLQDYDMSLAKSLIAGSDIWLNTPQPPREASGTSGMKAACNGVPSLSVLDGWWIEGHIEGVTGWSIPGGASGSGDESGEVNALYDKLERVIVPLYYRQPDTFAEVMRSAIAHNASFFNTQRVVSQYMRNAYSELATAKV